MNGHSEQQQFYPSDQSQSGAQPRPKRDYASIQVRTFSQKTALQTSLARNRQEIPTLMVEIAPVIFKSQNEKIGNWQEKIVFMLEADIELMQLIHFLSNKIKINELSFDFHGPASNKSLRLKRNADMSCMLQVSEAGKSHNIVIQPTYIAQILTLSFKAYASRFKIGVVDAVSILNISPAFQTPRSSR